ncbi:hypothetical protein AVEN_138236-1 [Araneus ventricosus]|uniref:Uncharacterized protein n=1 Tax=Araneus ventricosus TaxID=182803 RepID=A0A4Y2INT5_ARAVE|nr:hypothetical protein AVEN_138236-1 [Araneus ventricosus]
MIFDGSFLSFGKQATSFEQQDYSLTAPFYDDSGIIRVGGRLKNSMLTESQKHPILLPKTDHCELNHHRLSRNLFCRSELIAQLSERNFDVLAGDTVKE